MINANPVIHNGDHLQSLIDGKDPLFLAGDMDASHWADEWLNKVKENPSIATDKGAMLGWFANAIMTGYDIGLSSGYGQAKEEIAEHLAKD